MPKPTEDVLVAPGGFLDLETLIRSRIRDVIQKILEEELAVALGAGSHERSSERRGYRHGSRPPRTLVTSFGPTRIEVPRGRLQTEEGTREFESQIVRRYERRTRRVDTALVTSYLTGTNTRKLRLALQPLLEGTALSRSAISRVVQRLQGLFTAWRTRDLSRDEYAVVVLDGMNLPVRLARRVVKVPVQVVIGIRASGAKELLELRLAPSESLKSWTGVIEGLAERGMRPPRLVQIDGNAGLIRSIRSCWPQARIQRCTKHKWENVRSKAPKHCHEELKRDYDAVVYAEDRTAAETAYHDFVHKWEKLVPEVATSLQEAGFELLTFYDFPRETWRSLRTTNLIERVNEEFRRRVKTQGAFPTESAALVLLFGLIASRTIRLKSVDGHHIFAAFVEAQARQAA